MKLQASVFEVLCFPWLISDVEMWDFPNHLEIRKQSHLKWKIFTLMQRRDCDTVMTVMALIVRKGQRGDIWNLQNNTVTTSIHNITDWRQLSPNQLVVKSKHLIAGNYLQLTWYFFLEGAIEYIKLMVINWCHLKAIHVKNIMFLAFWKTETLLSSLNSLACRLDPGLFT